MFASVTGVICVALWLRLSRVPLSLLLQSSKELRMLWRKGGVCPRVLQGENRFITPHCAHLPLLEGLTSHVAPAGSLEHGEILPGLLIPLLLQLSQGAGPEKQLQFNTSMGYHQTTNGRYKHRQTLFPTTISHISTWLHFYLKRFWQDMIHLRRSVIVYWTINY